MAAGECARRLELEAVQALLLGERRVRPADVEAARRQLELGRDDLDAAGSSSIEAAVLTVSWTHLSPTQQPL